MPTVNEEVYIASFVKEDMRQAARQLAVVFRTLQDLEQEYNDNAASIIAQYTSGDIIDEKRGNDGVPTLTKADILAALVAMQSVLAAMTATDKDAIRKLLVTKLVTI